MSVNLLRVYGFAWGRMAPDCESDQDLDAQDAVHMHELLHSEEMKEKTRDAGGFAIQFRQNTQKISFKYFG